MANTPARGAPNPDRPRLSAAVEMAFAPIDRKAAEGYTAVENVVDAIDQGLANGSISVTLEITDTVIHHLEQAKAAADPDPDDPDEKK